MPKGPQGQERPADVIGNAIRIARIATGEEHETPPTNTAKAAAGKAGGNARSRTLTPDQRREIAKAGAKARHD